jgi:hypothetical protein
MHTFENCREDVEDLAVQYVLKRLEGKAQAAFETHIHSCAKCKRVVSMTETIVTALRDATAEHPPATE